MALLETPTSLLDDMRLRTSASKTRRIAEKPLNRLHFITPVGKDVFMILFS
jgi:hypothetical protein